MGMPSTRELAKGIIMFTSGIKPIAAAMRRLRMKYTAVKMPMLIRSFPFSLLLSFVFM